MDLNLEVVPSQTKSTLVCLTVNLLREALTSRFFGLVVALDVLDMGRRQNKLQNFIRYNNAKIKFYEVQI